LIGWQQAQPMKKFPNLIPLRLLVQSLARAELREFLLLRRLLVLGSKPGLAAEYSCRVALAKQIAVKSHRHLAMSWAQQQRRWWR